MPMTITQKILAAHCGREKVHPGEIIMADIDLALGNDITAPISIKILRERGIKKVFDRDKIALVPDHFAPNKDIASAQQCKELQDFAREYGITHYFELGEMGVEHALLPEKGLVLPGELIIGDANGAPDEIRWYPETSAWWMPEGITTGGFSEMVDDEERKEILGYLRKHAR